MRHQFFFKFFKHISSKFILDEAWPRIFEGCFINLRTTVNCSCTVVGWTVRPTFSKRLKTLAFYVYRYRAITVWFVWGNEVQCCVIFLCDRRNHATSSYIGKHSCFFFYLKQVCSIKEINSLVMISTGDLLQQLFSMVLPSKLLSRFFVTFKTNYVQLFLL